MTTPRLFLMAFALSVLPVDAVAQSAAGTNSSRAAADALSDVGPASTDCTYEFGSTNGNLAWCISEHGNLMRFTSPAGQEHIRIGGFQEGYVLCTGGGTYADIGLAEEGWGPPTLLVRTGSSVTIRRVTNDGLFQLDQRWTRDNVRRDLTVRMIVTNLGPTQNVILRRNADLDVDNDFQDDRWDQSAHSGWVRDLNAVTMSALTIGRRHTIVIDAPSLIDTTCSPVGAVPSPGGPGDPGVSVIYDLGSMRTRAVLTVEVNYRAQ